MNVFNDVLEFFDLYEVPFFVPLMTWNNSQDGLDNIQERLDRIVADPDWFSLFHRAEVLHSDFDHSDHRPEQLSLAGSMGRGLGWTGHRAIKSFFFTQVDL